MSQGASFDGSKGSDRPSFPGSEWLVASRPRDVLQRLLDGDPLRLGIRTERALSDHGVYLARERFKLRAIARVAFDAMRYRGEPALDAWLEARIDKAMHELLDEQRDEESRGLPVGASEDADYYAAFASAIGIEPELARLTCVALNRQPPRARRIFKSLVIDKQTPAACSALGLGAPADVIAEFRRTVIEVASAFELSGDYAPPFEGWSKP